MGIARGLDLTLCIDQVIGGGAVDLVIGKEWIFLSRCRQQWQRDIVLFRQIAGRAYRTIAYQNKLCFRHLAPQRLERGENILTGSTMRSDKDEERGFIVIVFLRNGRLVERLSSKSRRLFSLFQT